MQFAVCLWDLEPTDENIQSLSAQGVTAIELGALFLTARDDRTVRSAGEQCQDAGIRLYAGHPPFGGEADLSQLDEGGRRKAVTVLTQSLARAALAGIECAVIHPSGGSIGPEDQARRREQLLRSLDSLLVVAERLRVRLALENMLPNHIGASSCEILGIVERFDSPWLGVCFDIGHAHLNPEGALPAFEALRQRIITFHLQDNDGNSDRHLQPPYGSINWGAFARSFSPADFPFPWSVEAPPWNGGGWATQLREMQALFSVGQLAVPWGNSIVYLRCQRCGRCCFGTPERWSCECGEFVNGLEERN